MYKNILEKEGQETATTQPEYYDTSTGKVFTPAKMVAEGYKPKGKYKGHSLSGRVTAPSFGSIKRKKRKLKLKKLSYDASPPGVHAPIKTPGPQDGISNTETGARGILPLISGGTDISDSDMGNEIKDNPAGQIQDDGDIFPILINLADEMDLHHEDSLANFADFLIKKFAESQAYDPTDSFNNMLLKIKRMDIPNTNEIIKKLTNIYSRTIALEYNKNQNLNESKKIAYKKTLNRASQYLSEG